MSIAQNYLDVFQAEFSKLNTAQRQAVETLEGPVLVLAGPGTGKTQILSARIGNIILKTDTAPHNILCLTYTDAGTVAMRQRLLKFIGPDAYRVNIYTFHAFCNMVIQENLSHFGIRGLQPASEIEIVESIHKLIDNFSADNPLQRLKGQVYFDTENIRTVFDVMKKEGWSPAYISEKIDEYLADLPNREAFQYKKPPKGKKVGDLKETDFRDEQAKMEKLRAAAQEFQAYEELMLKLRRYDYHDMILWVLDTFKNYPEILLSYQERFQYFLVDEYQDTNGSQNEILHLLASYWEKPNVFVVGDDDQSIYRFQGANVRNITDFTHRYAAHLQIVVLTENYRSAQSILDASTYLISKNTERLVRQVSGLSKELNAAGINNKYEAKPVLTEYYGVLHEELGVVKELEALASAGVDLAEVAVIYRSHKDVANIVKLLQSRNLPLNIKRKTDVLTLPIILNFINILRYIREEYDRPGSAEFRLYELMHYNFFGINPRDIAKMAREIYDSARSESNRLKWREVIASREHLFRMGLESASKISALEENLIYWIAEFRNMTVQSLFEKILTRSGVLAWVMKQPDKVEQMQVITTFFDFIKEESSRKADLSLTMLLDQIEKMLENKIALPMDRSVHAEHGINFVTAHSSKGLEFDHVFVVACAKDNWEGKRAKASFSFPDTLTEAIPQNHIEEERRLFFVAMTRAKKFLRVSWPASGKGDKALEKSQFIAELLEEGQLPVGKVHLEDHEIISAQAELMLGAGGPRIQLLDEDYIRKQLQSYTLSVTHLNKYLKCPLSFYFENIVRVPAARNENMGFGSAVHYALETLYQRMLEHPAKEFPSLEDFMQFFDWGMKMYHSHFTPMQRQRRIKYASQILPEVYENCVKHTNKQVLVEFNMKGLEIDGIPINGKLDKIEFEDGSVTVVDYKTGKYDTADKEKKLVGPSDKHPDGGDYWRQVVFYRILLDNYKQRPMSMSKGEIFFVEPDAKKGYVREKIFVTPADLVLVKEQIHRAWEGIHRLEFDRGCGDEKCNWCNFVKNNYSADFLIADEAEEE